MTVGHSIFRSCIVGSLVAAAGACVASAQPAEKTYVVRFPKASQVGERYELKGEQTRSTKVQMRVGEVPFGGEPAEGSETVEFEGTVEVLAVDDDQQESWVRFTVGRVLLKEDENEIHLLPAGSAFVAAAGERGTSPTVIGVTGADISKGAESYLLWIVEMGDIDITQAFGSDTPRRPGEAWQVDKKILGSILKKQGVKLNEKDMAGSSKIARAYEQEGKMLLDVEISASFPIMLSDTPDGQADTEPAKMTLVQKLTMPAEPGSRPLASSQTTTMHFENTGKKGEQLAGITMVVDVTESRTATYKPLPAEETAAAASDR